MSSPREKLFAAVGFGGVLLMFPAMIITGWFFAGGSQDLLQAKGQRSNCGPVALKMIFDHHNIDCSLAAITEQVNPSPRGSSLLSLKTMAERKGLKTEGWLLAFDDLRRIPLPAIVYVNGNHYAVVDSISENDTVFTRDARGVKVFSQEEFLQAWHGETLIVPGPWKAGTPRLAGTKRTNSQTNERVLP